MYNKLFFFIFLIIITTSCVDNPKVNNSKNDSEIEGFWNRLGTIRYVNNIPVDTTLIKSQNEWFKQIKVYKDGNMIWLNNARDTLTPWKGGSGGYAKIKIHSKDSLTESMSNGTGSWGVYVKNTKDSLNIPYLTIDLKTYINKDTYTQKFGNNTEVAELWGRMKKLKEKTKLDGAWKRVYEIAYINNIPVDTIAIPSDVSLDVKIISNGRYTYQVDNTELAEPDSPMYGGYGGYGTFEFDNEKNELIEYQEWGSGMNTQSLEPKTNPEVHKITFFNDDLFIQISDRSASLINSNIKGVNGRGVVYRRIK